MKRSSVWKNVELKIARYLGGDRNPITGRVRDNTLPDIGKAKIPLTKLPDIDESAFDINIYNKILAGAIFDVYNFEIKHRQAFPLWLSILGDSARSEGAFILHEGLEITTLERFRYFCLTGRKEFLELQVDIPATLPKWLLDAKNQAEMSVENKVPVVILHAKNKKIKDSIVLIWQK